VIQFNRVAFAAIISTSTPAAGDGISESPCRLTPQRGFVAGDNVTHFLEPLRDDSFGD